MEMIRKKVKERIVILTSLVVILGLAGCGKKPVQGRTVIRFFNPQGLSEEIKITKEIITKFEKDNPDIKVKFEWGGTPDKVLVEIAGGTPPDVFLTWCETAPLAEKNALLELDEYINKYNLNLDDYFPFAIDFSTYKDKLYALPVNMHLPVVFYNKDMFEKRGIPYPDGSWTWDDFYQIAKKLTRDSDNDGKRDQFGTQSGGPYGWWVLPNKGWMFDMENKRANIKSKEVIEGLKFAYKLSQDTCPTYSEIKTFGGTGKVSPFMTGKVGMFIQPVAYISIFSKVKNFHWDIAPLPIPPHGKRINLILAADSVAISRMSKHPEEAFRFLKYYCGKEGMEILASHKRFILPYKQAAYESFVPPPEGIEWLANIIKEPYSFDPLHGTGDARWEEIMTSFYGGWDLILLGNVEFDEGIDKIEKEMNQLCTQLFK